MSNQITAEMVREALAAAKEVLAKHEAENDHKLVTGDGPMKEVMRLSATLKLLEAGRSVSRGRPGFVIVDGTMEVSLISGKWRYLGRNKWFWCALPPKEEA